MSRPPTALWLAAVTTTILLVVAVVISLRSRSTESQAFTEPTESMRLGLALQPSSALAMIAFKEGLFAQAGLDVTAKDYVSGKRALAAMLAGEVDVATTAEVPIVFAAFERQDISIAATIASNTNVERVVARKDRGITVPSDLRGKRVATQRGSAVHFFLHLFLVKNGLAEEEVVLSYMKAEDLPKALVNGEIDAFSMREPYVSQAVEQLGDDAVVFAEPGLYYRSEHLIASKHFIGERPSAVRKMIQALLQAEQFARNQPDRAIAIVAARLQVSESALASSWPHVEMHVSLDQSLIRGMEDEARWAIEAGLTEKSEMPNYLDIVYCDGLEAVKPEAVTIIR